MVILIIGALPAQAASSVTGADMTAAFQQNGSCLVTLELNLHLEGDSQNLQYPLPGNARSVTINGNSARTSQSGGLLLVIAGWYINRKWGQAHEE